MTCNDHAAASREQIESNCYAHTRKMQLPGEQVEHAFTPKRLCSWEVPRAEKSLARTATGTLKPRTTTTRSIVDARGHLLPGKRLVLMMPTRSEQPDGAVRPKTGPKCTRIHCLEPFQLPQ